VLSIAPEKIVVAMPGLRIHVRVNFVRALDDTRNKRIPAGTFDVPADDLTPGKVDLNSMYHLLE